MNRAYFSLLVISMWAAGALSAFAVADPNALFQQASLLESKGENAQALTLYQQIITEFPDSPMAGSDYAGYHVKFIALRQAISANDLASAKTIAAQIKALASSPEQKANQLVMTAGQLETKVELLADAAALYQQVIAEFPASPMAGPDYAAFNIKFIALREALSDSNLAPAKVIAAQIKALASSPQQKASQLAMAAGQLETKVELFADAAALYQQLITDFPNSPFAGPDYAGYRVKVFALGKALADNDIASAKTIAAQIKSLASSPQQKPDQLYWTASQLESKVELTADAAALYQQIVTEFPNSPMAGPDYAGYRARVFALGNALSGDDLATAKTIAAQIKALASSPQQKPDQLYSTASRLESKVELTADAAALYQQIIADFPASPMAGPDYAGYRVKVFALGKALADNDIASAKAIAAQIKALASSPQQKPDQLYWTAGQLESKNELLADAAALYQQIITEFPNSPLAGPDYAAFNVKFIALRQALSGDDLASAKTIAAQIKALASSPQQKPDQLARTAGQLETKVELFIDAAALYRQLITEFPNSPMAGPDYAGFRVKIFDFCKALSDNDLASAKAIAAQIKSKYADAGNKLTAQLFAMAEECYTAGQKNNQSEFFRQSADMFENDVLTRSLSDGEKTTAFYMLGLNYELLGEYAKAANAFANSYQTGAAFRYADYCLYAQGRCYEKLLEQKLVSEVESKAMTSYMYTQLLQIYPDSKGATYARNWLKNNPE